MSNLIVQSTTPDKPSAETIGKLAIQEKVAACSQISGPITSIYEWNNTTETKEEYLIQFKTTEEKYPHLETLIIKHHPYDTPEIIATPITNGSEKYLTWISESLK